MCFTLTHAEGANSNRGRDRDVVLNKGGKESRDIKRIRNAKEDRVDRRNVAKKREGGGEWDIGITIKGKLQEWTSDRTSSICTNILKLALELGVGMLSELCLTLQWALFFT